jgi:hypothetical protein
VPRSTPDDALPVVGFGELQPNGLVRFEFGGLVDGRMIDGTGEDTVERLEALGWTFDEAPQIGRGVRMTRPA